MAWSIKENLDTDKFKVDEKSYKNILITLAMWLSKALAT